SFDLYQSSNTTTMRLLDEDALEPVEWEALLPANTPEGIVYGDNRALLVYSGHIGAVYDPTVIAESDAPRSLKDLANPRWGGRFMLYSYNNNYVAYTLVLDKDEALSALRGAVRNGGVADIYSNIFTRYAAREYPLVLLESSYYATVVARGIPARFISLDASF